jgi:hypothetical protein
MKGASKHHTYVGLKQHIRDIFWSNIGLSLIKLNNNNNNNNNKDKIKIGSKHRKDNGHSRSRSVKKIKMRNYLKKPLKKSFNACIYKSMR